MSDSEILTAQSPAPADFGLPRLRWASTALPMTAHEELTTRLSRCQRLVMDTLRERFTPERGYQISQTVASDGMSWTMDVSRRTARMRLRLGRGQAPKHMGTAPPPGTRQVWLFGECDIDTRRSTIQVLGDMLVRLMAAITTITGSAVMLLLIVCGLIQPDGVKQVWTTTLLTMLVGSWVITGMKLDSRFAYAVGRWFGHETVIDEDYQEIRDDWAELRADLPRLLDQAGGPTA